MVLTTQNNLACLLRDYLQDYKAALPLDEAVVASTTNLYGPTHEKTLAVRGNRAVTYQNLKRYDEARAEPKALPRLGLRHPHTMSTQCNLARLLYHHGDDESLRDETQGQRLLRDAWEVQITVLGADHTDTQRSAASLAKWCQKED